MPYDDDQLANLDAELDGLVSPTTAQVLDHSQDYDAGFVAASAARRAIEGAAGGGSPTGAAGGVLGGTYPNPSFAADMATQAELDALSLVYQPVDSDLTSIAALTTTAFGRGLLELANQAALLSAAGAAAAVHAHAGEDITSGTVADARIASTIARDSEVTSAISALSTVYQPLDSDLTAVAALTTTSYGRALLALADQAALQTAVGAYVPGGTDVAVTDGGTGASTAATARSNLGVAIERISTSTLGSPAANFDLTSIPGTYSALRIIWVGATSHSAAVGVNLIFNNDSTSIYDRMYFNGVSSMASSTMTETLATTSALVGTMPASTATSMAGSGTIDIPFYAGTVFHKNVHCAFGDVRATTTGNINHNTTFGRWRSTAAVTRITLTPSTGNWIVGSSYSLYGVL